MTAPTDLDAAINTLVDRYRARCLWFLRPDDYPSGREQLLRALDYIQRRHGDREAFVRAAELRTWLLQSSNDGSAVS